MEKIILLTPEVQQQQPDLLRVLVCTTGMLALVLGWTFVGKASWNKKLMTDLRANPAILVETLSPEQLQILQSVVAQEMDQRRMPASENGEIVSK